MNKKKSYKKVTKIVTKLEIIHEEKHSSKEGLTALFETAWELLSQRGSIKALKAVVGAIIKNIYNEHDP